MRAKTKDKAGADLVRKRWAKTTVAQRLEVGRILAEARADRLKAQLDRPPENLMDFQLHNGKRLAEATREDVLEDAAWWRKEARRMFRDAEVLKQFLKDSK